MSSDLTTKNESYKIYKMKYEKNECTKDSSGHIKHRKKDMSIPQKWGPKVLN